MKVQLYTKSLQDMVCSFNLSSTSLLTFSPVFIVYRRLLIFFHKASCSENGLPVTSKQSHVDWDNVIYL